MRSNGPFGLLQMRPTAPTLPGALSVELRNWFSDEELRACPNCGQMTALQTPRGGFVVCFDCGLVTPSGERVGDLHALPPPPERP